MALLSLMMCECLKSGKVTLRRNGKNKAQAHHASIYVSETCRALNYDAVFVGADGKVIVGVLSSRQAVSSGQGAGEEQREHSGAGARHSGRPRGSKQCPRRAW